MSGDTGTPSTAPHGLTRIALPLLTSAGLLRATRQVPNPATLQARLREALSEFRSRAEELGYPPEDVDKARYALCALVDENALSTPWGSTGWGMYALLKEEYAESFGGARFFSDLDQVLENEQADADLLELLYLCLTLGFEGKFRGSGYSEARNDVLRRDLLRRIVRQRTQPVPPSRADETAANQGKGADRFRPPPWFAWTLAGLLLLAGFRGFQYANERTTQPLIQALHEIGQITEPVGDQVGKENLEP